jgi:O-antigen ligase
VVATAASPHAALAARKLANLLVLGGLLFAVTDLLCEEPALRTRVATLLAVLGTVCGGLAVLETVGVLPGPFPRWGTPYSRAALGFGQPNGLGLYLAVVLPLVAWRGDAAASTTARWLWRGALAITAAGLLGTFSRGSWGAVIVGAGALAVAGAWRRSLRLIGGALLAAVVLDLVSGGVVRDRIAETIGDWVVEQRAALMIAGVLMFLDRPLVGFGPGGFEPELDRYGIQVPELFDFQATPHNAYVQMAAETGIVGLLLYGALLALLLRAAGRAARASADERQAALERALLWSLGVIVTAGFFIWPYALDTGQAAILVFALIASSPALLGASQLPPRASSR